MAFKDISKERLFAVLNPKRAREVDRANAQDAARERERTDHAKRSAEAAHPEKQEEPPQTP